MKKYFLKSVFLIISVILFSCSKSDDDNSSCPKGFTGTNCSTKITPNKMYITKVVVKSYPLINHTKNDFWDAGDFNTSVVNADMFLVFDFNGIEIKTNEIKNNVKGEVTFEFGNNFPLGDINEDLVGLFVLDSDDVNNLDNSEIMAVKYFKIYEFSGISFPSVITVEEGSLIADIYVTYEW